MVHLTTVPVSLFFLRGQPQFMAQRGMEVHAVSSPGAELEAFGREEGVIVQAVPMRRQISPLADFGALMRLARLLWQLRPDIVHAHTPKGGLLGILAGRITRVPVCIYHLHGLPFQTAGGLRRRLLLLSDRVACRFAHQVLCVSRSALAVAEEAGVCTPGKGKVLLAGSINGVDGQWRFDPERLADSSLKLRHELGLPEESLVLGYVGRVVRDKGVVELAEAWRLLRERYADLHLVIVGPVEREDPVPEAVLAELRCDTRVRLTGTVADPAPYYGLFDVLALPSHREGFGLVALEAAAMKVPVVATRICGVVDAVENGVTGLLVPPKDHAALAAAVASYLDDATVRRRHGRAARRRALDSFQPVRMAEAVFAEYGRLQHAR